MNDAQLMELKSRIAALDSISTAPAILQPLLAMMRLPADEIRMEHVVELVSRDGAIAAQCLRVANSPLFGRNTVETVARRRHGTGPRPGSLDSFWLLHEPDHPRRQVGA